MERRKLSGDELTAKLAVLDGWALKGDSIVRRYDYSNFAESLAFVNRVGAIAEKHDHHPDITFGWGYAEVVFTTHDRGGVTDFDIELAARVDKVR